MTMRKYVILTVFSALGLMAALPQPAAAVALPAMVPGVACESLAGRVVDADGAPARINSAKVESANTAAAFCKVEGYVAPQVRFEVRMPMSGWTQRLLFTGCGGFCGNVTSRVVAANDCPMIRSGEMALVTSDLGHQAGGTDGVWAVNNAQGVRDWGYRGVHVSTRAAKSILKIFYNQEPRFSYFSGCSDGGREGLKNAEKYPDDFDGIIAGAPVYNVTANNTILHGWIAQTMLNRDGTPRVNQASLNLVREEVARQCDAIDGQRDGRLSRPESCQPELDGLVCTSTGQSGCVPPEQLALIKAMYTGPVNEKGVPLYFGPAVGSEGGWLEMARGSVNFASNFVSYITGEYTGEINAWDVAYTPKDLKRYNTYADELNAVEDDLRGFNRSGGKLLLWHGWADPGVPAGATIAWYEKLKKKMGAKSAEGFTRLYMLPGVGHCSGGDGPDRFDLLSKLMAWVEDRAAPDALQATNGNAPDRPWLIAPWPAAPTVPAGLPGPSMTPVTATAQPAPVASPATATAPAETATAPTAH